MKIRTDFVTNSSSSSFITITVTTKNNSKFEGGFDAGDQSFIDPDVSCGPLMDEDDLSHMNGEELLGLAKTWFDSTFEDAENYDFSKDGNKRISELSADEIKTVKFSYNVDLSGEMGFTSYESYDYENNTHDYEMEPDPEWEEF